MALSYNFNISGTTFSGSTAFFNSQTTYFPLENFSRAGTLLVETTVGASNFETTDANNFDIGIFAGSIADFSAGVLNFTSNTILQTYIGGNFSQLAGIDVVEQGFDPVAGIWSYFLVDETTTRAAQLNVFNTSSSFTAAPKQAILGRIDLRFSQDLRTVEGSVLLGGTGFIEPSTSLYQANFSGSLNGQYVGLAEQNGGLDTLLGAVGFNSAAYLASHGDLLTAFGYSPDLARQHYAQFGLNEGRTITFQADDYIASHADLISAFGYNLAAATEHYVRFGAFEGRSPDAFNEVAYLNKYADLQQAFGRDTEAATRHFIQFGFFEGRTA